MKGPKFILVSLTCLLFPMYAGADTPGDFISPDDFISDIVNLLAERMDGHSRELSDDEDALYKLIDEVLLSRFDRKLAARQVLARHWREASEDQRTRFIAAFYTNLVQRYAHLVLDFEHDRVKVLPFRGDTSKRTVTVKTYVDLVTGKTVSINYTLVPRDSSWMMMNFEVEGVSFVKNYREQYGIEIRATSLDQLIARLEEEASGSGDE